MLNQNFIRRFINLRKIGFIFFMLIAACSSEDPEFVIPDEFTVYVDRFVSEVRDRGITIKVDN